MKSYSLLMALVVLLTLQGCATPLTAKQEMEYDLFESNHVLVKKKSPILGMVLGVLPGGGSFYAREPASGVLGILLWPLSVFWDPVSGYQGSKTINYLFTKNKLRIDLKRELAALYDERLQGRIDETEYKLERQEVMNRYQFE